MSKKQSTARKLAILFTVIVGGQLSYLAPAVALTKEYTGPWAAIGAVVMIVAGWLTINCWAAPRMLDRLIGDGMGA